MKKTIVTTLQIAVTAFALYWVFRDPQTRAGMVAALRTARWPWLVAALVAAGFAPLVATVRLWVLVRLQNPRFRLGRIAQLYLVGSFFNLMLPGSNGGDAVKAFYLLRASEPRQRAGVILAVIMDRILGLMALLILAAVFLTWRYQWLTQTPAVAKMVNGFAVLLALAVSGVVVVFATVQLRLIDRLPARLPGRTKFIELAGAIALYSREWPTTLLGVGMSFVGHGALFVTFWCAAQAVRARLSLLDISVIMPVVNTFVALPISVSGMGVRESLLKTTLYDLCGIGADQAVPISVLGFLCTVVFYGLVGGVVYLFFRSQAGPLPAHVEEVEAQMEAEQLPRITKEIEGTHA